MSLTRRTLLHGAALAAISPAAAQTGTWPARPLRIIIPTAAGGSPDLVARTIGNKLTERFGQPVVVERDPGRGHGRHQMVAKSAPDGGYLGDADRRLHHPGGGDEEFALRPRPRFRLRDQRRRLSDVPAGRANSPIASFKDLLERARAEPGKVSYAIIGGGSVYHLLGKWIENRAGIEHGGRAVSRLGGGLHRRDRWPARCHARHRDLGHPAHPHGQLRRWRCRRRNATR